MKKKALIFGITGQDGYYLAKLLLKKNYKIFGVVRRTSAINRYRIDLLPKSKNLILVYGDVTDSLNTLEIIKKAKPNEIYNLSAQSHVAVSFKKPHYTTSTIVYGSLNILESLRILNLKKTKYYQASSSEMFGNNHLGRKLNENSKFEPRSVYAVSKVYSYFLTKMYRKTYNIFASNGILFNHESAYRGETFVTKKIISALVKIKLGKIKKITVGNIFAQRDWGYAKDYVEAMWEILQAKKPDDFVIATGKTTSVKNLIEIVLKKLKMKCKWEIKKNKIKVSYNKKIILESQKALFRPSDVAYLKGDYSKAKKILNWKPKTNLNKLIDIIVDYEFKTIKK